MKRSCPESAEVESSASRAPVDGSTMNPIKRRKQVSFELIPDLQQKSPSVEAAPTTILGDPSQDDDGVSQQITLAVDPLPQYKDERGKAFEGSFSQEGSFQLDVTAMLKELKRARASTIKALEDAGSAEPELCSKLREVYKSSFQALESRLIGRGTDKDQERLRDLKPSGSEHLSETKFNVGSSL
jgi:hypothetical protein